MSDLDRPLVKFKTDLVERAIKLVNMKSIVDLGACWGVNGGYTFHALEHANIKRAIIVDGHITQLTRDRAKKYPQVELIQCALSGLEAIDKVGKVDCAIMFDILLHQVSPDWKELISSYAKNLNSIIIYNQNWIGDAQTVRFVDFGLDEYLRRVFHTNMDGVRQWFEKHDQTNVQQGKPWRDVHNYWQWGITQNDLVSHLWDLGFQVLYMERNNTYNVDFPEIRNDGLICVRR